MALTNRKSKVQGHVEADPSTIPFTIALVFSTNQGHFTIRAYMRDDFLKWLRQCSPEEQADVKNTFLNALTDNFNEAIRIV